MPASSNTVVMATSVIKTTNPEWAFTMKHMKPDSVKEAIHYVTIIIGMSATHTLCLS